MSPEEYAVIEAAITWQKQGARTKWCTPNSIALWDAVEKLRTKETKR